MEKNEWKVNSRGEQDRRREKLDDDEIPWVTKKFAGNCSGWRMTGGILLTVTRGDDSRLCHADDVSAKGSKDARWGSRSFFEVLWSCSNDR
jgi:hypothetical protein